MITSRLSVNRVYRLLPALAVALLATAGCKDKPTEVAPLEISNLVSQLVAISGGDNLTNQSEKSIRDLADAIARVMANKSQRPPEQIPGPFAAAAGPALASPVLGYLVATPEPVYGLPRLNGTSQFDAGPDELPPGALGKTCVWNLDNDRYKGGPDLFGPVPVDGTRFELYQTQNKLPLKPLQLLGTYSEARVFRQADLLTNPHDVSVSLLAALPGASPLTSVLLTGKTNANGGPLDILMTGGAKTGGGSPLDYILSINDLRSANVMQVSGLLIVASIDASTSPRTVKLLVQQRSAPREGLEFQFSLSASGAISSGNVYVGADQVASMSGDRLAPTFARVGAELDNFDGLATAYQSVLLLDGRINTMFFIAHCIAADNKPVCDLMASALGG